MIDPEGDAHPGVPGQALQAEDRALSSHAGDLDRSISPLGVEFVVPDLSDVTFEGAGGEPSTCRLCAKGARSSEPGVVEDLFDAGARGLGGRRCGRRLTCLDLI